MNYDDIVEQILQEAYFSNPYEKATGIKRQVGLVEQPTIDDLDTDKTEFRGTKDRKGSAMHLAVQRAVMEYEAMLDRGEGFPDVVDDETGRTKKDPKGKDWLLHRFIALLVNKDSGTVPGDIPTEDDYIRALHALGHATGISGEETGAQLKYHKKRKWGPGFSADDPELKPGDPVGPNSIPDDEARYKPIMSLPGFMGMLKKAEDKLKKKMAGNKMSSRDPDIEEDPGKKSLAHKRLEYFKKHGTLPDF